MSRKQPRKEKENDALQDLIDTQEHRYDSDFWINKTRRGELTPLAKQVGELHFSTFSKAMMIFLIVGPLLFGLFTILRDRLPHVWLWCTIALVLCFLGLWYFIGKSVKHYGFEEKDKR